MRGFGVILLGAVLAVQPFNVTLNTQKSQAQDITRVLPNGVTVVRDPGMGITVSRETPRRSFSFSIGRGTAPSATASASATGTHRAFASASTSAAVRTNANGQSIDIARARAVARGNISTSTSAVTKF